MLVGRNKQDHSLYFTKNETKHNNNKIEDRFGLLKQMDIPSTTFQGQEGAPVSFPLWIFNKRSRSKQGGLIPWGCKGSSSLERGNFAYSSCCVVSRDVFFAGINWHGKSIHVDKLQLLPGSFFPSPPLTESCCKLTNCSSGSYVLTPQFLE